MSSDISIRVTNLSKCYHIYEKPQDRLKQSLWRGRKQFYREFWALRDVSFEVKKGETVGIIGRNGSGKSTLLQLICGTLTPTYGTADIHGRVAALLELGAGFNPEFTGRENVYLNGALLGLSKQDIDARLDDIAAFADIGQFIGQPVKTYSSGMYMRLAFAVQVNVVPDILVVDEALAVGDFAFTLKCLKRIEDLRAKGSSILFVSHDIALVQKLCDRVLYLDRGETAAFGDPRFVCSRYISSMTPRIKDNVDADHATGTRAATASHPLDHPARLEAEAAFATALCGHRAGNRHAEITFVTLRTTNGGNVVMFDEAVEVQVFLRIHRPVTHLCVSMYVIDEAGQLLLGTSTHSEDLVFPELVPGDCLQVDFGFRNRLRDGKYGITTIASTYLSVASTEYLDYIEPALLFQVVSATDKVRWCIYSPPFNLHCFVNGTAVQL